MRASAAGCCPEGKSQTFWAVTGRLVVARHDHTGKRHLVFLQKYLPGAMGGLRLSGAS